MAPGLDMSWPITFHNHIAGWWVFLWVAILLRSEGPRCWGGLRWAVWCWARCSLLGDLTFWRNCCMLNITDCFSSVKEHKHESHSSAMISIYFLFRRLSSVWCFIHSAIPPAEVKHAFAAGSMDNLTAVVLTWRVCGWKSDTWHKVWHKLAFGQGQKIHWQRKTHRIIDMMYANYAW
jgi:hypothetical protein